MRHTVLVALAAAGLALGACSTTTERPEGTGDIAPALTVERFLQAVSSQDLEAMSHLFGTAEGPIAERPGGVGCFFRWLGGIFGVDGCPSRLEVQRRMLALATVLEHDDYRMGSQERAPAREHPSVRVRVTLIRGDATYSGVPFLVVQSKGGSWLIEEIGVQAVTDRPGE